MSALFIRLQSAADPPAPCSLPIVYIDVNAVPGKLVYANGIKVCRLTVRSADRTLTENMVMMHCYSHTHSSILLGLSQCCSIGLTCSDSQPAEKCVMMLCCAWHVESSCLCMCWPKQH